MAGRGWFAPLAAIRHRPDEGIAGLVVTSGEVFLSAEFAADEQPYGVFIDNNLGSNREYLRALCDALRPLKKMSAII